jgi:hypothetical protein
VRRTPCRQQSTSSRLQQPTNQPSNESAQRINKLTTRLFGKEKVEQEREPTSVARWCDERLVVVGVVVACDFTGFSALLKNIAVV